MLKYNNYQYLVEKGEKSKENWVWLCVCVCVCVCEGGETGEKDICPTGKWN